MKIDNLAETITTLDGVTGLLMFISCLYDVPAGSEPTFKYKAPAFALLSDLVKSATDFLSEHDVDIEPALEQKVIAPGTRNYTQSDHKQQNHNTVR